MFTCKLSTCKEFWSRWHGMLSAHLVYCNKSQHIFQYRDHSQIMAWQPGSYREIQGTDHFSLRICSIRLLTELTRKCRSSNYLYLPCGDGEATEYSDEWRCCHQSCCRGVRKCCTDQCFQILDPWHNYTMIQTRLIPSAFENHTCLSAADMFYQRSLHGSTSTSLFQGYHNSCP